MTAANEITMRTEADVCIIDIKGDVTPMTAEPLEAAYKNATVSGAQKLVLTFDPASYINSGGIAVLIGIVSASNKKGQKIRMAGLSAHFQKIFSMVGLTRYAQVFASEQSALADF
jgi:anti-anti-sigma factor